MPLLFIVVYWILRLLSVVVVFAFAVIIVFPVAMFLLDGCRVGGVIFCLAGNNDAQVVLFIGHSFFELSPVGGGGAIR